MMRYVTIVRELLVIFSFVFTWSVLAALVTGAHLTNETVFSILIFTLVSVSGCLLFYLDRLVDFLGPMVVQLVYIAYLCVCFLVCNYLFSWNTPLLVMGILLGFILLGYLIGKWILFSISVQMTNKMNEQLKKKFQSRSDKE
ncbi:hypothetical protein NRIC_32440 [Enterococcus florum]|uniref:DUF3021 domain-containing protein n=1 Tax=Enterococcus florum TaxID=2480627 RepID=A0A4P5PRE5_9ENTE|nr:hypothetical protein [Enterococcus florum]GCF95353.1 hypothetical protein NRIC_32440 [Enterococcus florum]